MDLSVEIVTYRYVVEMYGSSTVFFISILGKVICLLITFSSVDFCNLDFCKSNFY